MDERISTAVPDVLALAEVDANAVHDGAWVGQLANGRHILITKPATVDVHGIARDAADWLDGPLTPATTDLACTVHRLVGEAGTAAASTLPPTPDSAQLCHATMAELARQALLALIAIEGCGYDSAETLGRAAGRIAALMHLDTAPPHGA